MKRNNNKPLVVIGPSGAGKSTFIDIVKHDGDIIADIKQDVLSYEARTGLKGSSNLRQIYKSFFMELNHRQPTIIEIATDFTGLIKSELDNLYDDYTLVLVKSEYETCKSRQKERHPNGKVNKQTIQTQFSNIHFWLKNSNVVYET